MILILAGLLDIVNGLWALDHKNTPGDALLYENNLETWGWFYLIVGIVVVVAGLRGVPAQVLGGHRGRDRRRHRRVTNMFWIFQYPLASIVLVIIYVMVIYALVVYGANEEYVE